MTRAEAYQEMDRLIEEIHQTKSMEKLDLLMAERELERSERIKLFSTQDPDPQGEERRGALVMDFVELTVACYHRSLKDLKPRTSMEEYRKARDFAIEVDGGAVYSKEGEAPPKVH